MAEIVEYRHQWTGSTPLAPAIAYLKHLGGSLEASQHASLITTGLGGMNDSQVAGFTARCPIGHGTRAQTLVWTIRWDYDDTKGPHVNGNFVHSGQTEKFAWLELNEHDNPKNPILSASYGPTLKKLTTDCGWDVGVWHKKSGADADAYKAACAAQGLKMWESRLGGQ